MLLLISFLACGDKESDTSSTDTIDTTDTSVDDTDITDTNDTEEDSTNAESLQVGDIVISEIMKNPCGVTGSEIAVSKLVRENSAPLIGTLRSKHSAFTALQNN